MSVLNAVEVELRAARAKHPKFMSMHHGYAVILEELDEVWEEIKKREPDPEKLRKELVQVAAVSVRFVEDLLP